MTNTLTGLAEAVKNRTPLVLVAGDTPGLAPGGNLDIDQDAVARAVHHFVDLGLPTDIAQLEDRDFAAVARALGAQGLTVRRVEDLEGVREWLESRDGPMLLDCKVNPRVRAEWLEEAFRPAAA